ncbi:caspase recruitment domain family member 9 [Cricetulus griseus]
MSDYENDDECWSALESFRVKLISVIDPSRITPYLRQCKVLNPDDEEQVLSDPNLVIRKRKVGVLLDILQRTGHKGYVAFLESLELYYPQLYRKVTGKEPARVFSMIIDASGESGLTQLLMTEVMKLQKKVQDLTALLSSKDDFIKELRVKDSLLRKHQERVQRLKEECELSSRELKRCKDENYDLAMRLAHLSEEKGSALMRNRDLQLEVDRLRHSLMKAEDDCKVERKHTLKLRHAMEQRPSQELMWELQQEKDLLQARVQELEVSVQVGLPAVHTRGTPDGTTAMARLVALCHLQEGKLDRNSPYIQVLQEDWRQALQEHQEQANTIFSLRKDLRQAEALRTRCVEEREMFELQCLALRKDAKMYKDRIEAILQQMEEVSIERDQAMASREELHAQCAQSFQDKDELRKQVRELSEKADELQLQLFQSEGRLVAAEGRLKQQQLDMLILESQGSLGKVHGVQLPAPFLVQGTGPSSSEPPEKERRRLKESFENYRRKRALRKAQNSWRQDEGDRENTTGSDNTDTEGS